jgi:uncharacterized protein YlxW (UPF0749 family)
MDNVWGGMLAGMVILAFALAMPGWAQETATVAKVDDNTVSITSVKNSSYDDIQAKVTALQNQIDQITNSVTQFALQGEEQKKPIQAQLDAERALLQQAADLGVVAKPAPVEEVKP